MKIRELEIFAAVANLMADGRPRTVNDMRVRILADTETISEAALQMVGTGILERSKPQGDDGIWIYQASRELRGEAA